MERAVWRPLTGDDLDAVLAIADIVHVDHPEAPEVFADRLRLFPAGCFLAEGASGPLGYCLAHPGVLGQPVPLDTVLGELPAAADCLYLHDIALLPAARGLSLGAAMVEMLAGVARAHGFGTIALTAVGNSPPFWRKAGFQPFTAPGLAEKLASYGEAHYLVRRCR